MAARLTWEDRRLRAMSENALQQRCMDVLRVCRWHVAHMSPAHYRVGGGERYVTPYNREAAGWPDILAIRGPRILAAELKTETGKLSDKQQQWLGWWEEAGAEVWVVRPSTWERFSEAVR